MTKPTPAPTPSPRQREAIEGPLGPVLVIAGPGAGKTFCLIGRVGHLIAKAGMAPERILAVTFTNKAAEEVATRLSETLGAAADEVRRGTLHRLCADILRAHGGAIGIDRGFGIADEAYQLLVLKRMGVFDKHRKWLLNLFGRHRLQGKPLTDARDEERLRRYTDALRAKSLLDFDDLVLRTQELFGAFPDIAAQVAAQWDYVLVDECQDLNPAQYEIVKTLGWAHKNVFAVGDDEQSIFAFTGADPQVLRRFANDFGIAQPIVLDRNRRCSIQIFRAARRLMDQVPGLWDKRLEAERTSDYDVTVQAFPDEVAEAAWIVEDLRADRAQGGLQWGDYAVLYRRHEIGDVLEGVFVQAGIPCRLARNRALQDDPVIAQVVASIRLMRDPGDTLHVERLADLVLPPVLLSDIRKRFADVTILDALRSYAKAGERSHPDVRRAWRFIFHVENLGAVYRGAVTLAGLVDALLAQPLGEYRNPLEDRHDELSDPADDPTARALAEKLTRALDGRALVWLDRQQGLEVALRGMLRGAGITTVRYRDPSAKVRPADVHVSSADAGAAGLTLTVFRALQLLQARNLRPEFTDYVAFDFETTDNVPAACDVVEIGAARVRAGKVVDRYHTLVKPGVPIARGATGQHGYTEADLTDAPSFRAAWPAFRAFIGDDELVAHNGDRFDVPVLKRLAAGLAGAENLRFHDSILLARSLYDRRSAKLGDLAERFGIDTGRQHHALDDAVTLAGVVTRLSAERIVRARKAALVNVLDWLGLGLVLDAPSKDKDVQVLKSVASVYALGRYSNCLDGYVAESADSPGAPTLDQVIDRLGGRRLMEALRTEKLPEQRYPAAVARLKRLVDASGAGALGESVSRFLELVALSVSDGAEVAPDRVNLLTLHATKGLEFSRVYVVGVEDDQLPGTRATGAEREREVEESRRLLYVGMTRAMDRLVLTRVERRMGRDTGGTQFLTEMGL